MPSAAAVEFTPRLAALLNATAADHSDNAAALALLTPDDWTRLLAEANNQGVMGLLHQGVALHPEWNVPAEAQSELADQFKTTHFSNWLLNNELLDVLKQLDDANLDAVVVKGAALASWVYDDIGLRPYTDVDVLVRERDLGKVRAILDVAGYKPTTTVVEGFPDNAGQTSYAKQRGYHPRLDLHWHLFVFEYYCQHIPIEWFWEHTLPITINGTPALTLDPLAQLLHLSCHAVLNHDVERLIWSYDMRLLVEQYPATLDWRELTRKAGEFGIAPAVKIALDRTVHWWNAPIPPEVLTTLSATPIDPRAQMVFQLATAPHREARLLLAGGSPSGLGNKLSFGVRHLFPTPAYMKQRYKIHNDWALAFYYPARVGMVAFKFVRSLGSTFLRRPSFHL